MLYILYIQIRTIFQVSPQDICNDIFSEGDGANVTLLKQQLPRNFTDDLACVDEFDRRDDFDEVNCQH